MTRWLVRLAFTLFACLIFALGCLLYWPAADWLPRLLPPQVTSVGLQGSLLGGGMQRLAWPGGGAGPWQWHLRWPGKLQVTVGEPEGAPWGMSLSGWPWQWQADLAGGDLRWLQAPGSALLAGRLTGEVRLAGSWRRCQAASGSWQGDALQVLVPRRLALGTARLQVDCQTAPWLQGVFDLGAQHHLEIRLSLANWRGQVQGTAQPGSEIAPVLQSIGWLKAGQTQVMGRF
ncbi:hypothetical protein [Pseudomonas aestiva]|uniref:hypothetical protein n=1 Tax=Pseudomonas aestiva TaxID=3136739 RepID=UPI003265768E